MAKQPEVSSRHDLARFDGFMKNVKHLLSGGIAGAIARTTTAPFERISIMQQTRHKDYKDMSVLTILKKMLKNEGIRSYFKGNGTNIIRIFPFSAIELFTFELFKYEITLNGPRFVTDNKSLLYFVSGAFAGMSATVVTYPLDVMRTLFAYQTV
mmetsp:Transcript_12772/g.10916  ORF Transcript_12772/g.10916 Transcript_12772/m.10916 type:complete len:154 (+) Transcript_12772:38-499(+)